MVLSSTYYCQTMSDHEFVFLQAAGVQITRRSPTASADELRRNLMLDLLVAWHTGLT